MGKKSRIELITEKHYKDMLDLNRRFISGMSRPSFPMQNLVPNPAKSKKKLSKKQLKALSDGRRVLALKRR